MSRPSISVQKCSCLPFCWGELQQEEARQRPTARESGTDHRDLARAFRQPDPNLHPRRAARRRAGGPRRRGRLTYSPSPGPHLRAGAPSASPGAGRVVIRRVVERLDLAMRIVAPTQDALAGAGSLRRRGRRAARRPWPRHGPPGLGEQAVVDRGAAKRSQPPQHGLPCRGLSDGAVHRVPLAPALLRGPRSRGCQRTGRGDGSDRRPRAARRVSLVHPAAPATPASRQVSRPTIGRRAGSSSPRAARGARPRGPRRRRGPGTTSPGAGRSCLRWGCS